LLQLIEGKVKSDPSHFHKFLAVLRSLPGLSQIASRLQASYGGYIARHCMEEYLIILHVS
jgi:hypothetical protein